MTTDTTTVCNVRPALAALTNSLDNAAIEKLIDLCRVAETAERYEDMCLMVKRLVELRGASKTELTVEERNLVSVAYKNVVGAKRASWRTLNATFDDVDAALIDAYKKIVETELEHICMELIGVLKAELIPATEKKNNEEEVFYLKMAGDYYRYMAEFRVSDEENEFSQGAQEYYQKASIVAEDALEHTHPTRLGLALNFSVCYYEILKKPEKACELAKKAFDESIEKLDTLTDASYKDSTLIMQLLRDNLTLWTSAEEDDD